MKKILLIIALNIFIAILIFALADFVLYWRNAKILYTSGAERLPYNYTTQTILNEFEKKNGQGRFLPYDKNFKSDKAPILLLGCSYTYGFGLMDDETLQGRLQKLTNRWVYNFGVVGRELFSSYYWMKKEYKKGQINPTPEYIIYTYMFHHMVRLAEPYFYDYYRDMDYLPNQKRNFLYRIYTYRYLKDISLQKEFWYDWEFKRHKKIFFKTLEETKKFCDENFPNSKFVILIYNDYDYNNIAETLKQSVGNHEYRLKKLFEIMDDKEFIQKIKDMGIEVITTQELIGRKMNKPEDHLAGDENGPHPSAYIWSEITPKLVERLKL